MMDSDESRALDGADLLAQALAVIPERSPHPLLTGKDLERLWLAAARHRLELPLAHWLGRSDLGPALAAERLWRDHQLRLAREIQDALEAHGISAVSLKGPALVERIYPNGAGRSSVDLDILVAEKELDLALHVLRVMGFNRVDRGWPLAANRKYGIEIELDRSGREDVEVHFRFSILFGRLVGSEWALSRKTRYRTSLGNDVWLLAPEDEFLFLALHAAKHSFHPLLLLFELKLFVLRYPLLDWVAVSDRARQIDVQTALWAAAQALSQRLRFDVPLKALSVRPSLLARWAWDVERHSRTAMLKRRGLHVWLKSHADHLLLCDNARRRITYVRQQVMPGVRWKLASRLRG